MAQFKLGIATGAERADGKVVGGGTWHCFRCQSAGSWYDLKKLSNGIQFTSSVAEVVSPQETRSGTAQPRVRPKLKMPNQETARRFTPTLMNESKFPEVCDIKDYLTAERGLSMEVLSKYGVGIGQYEFPDGNAYVKAFCVTFPWVMTLAELKSQDKELGTVTDLTGINRADNECVFRRVKARAWNRKGWQKLDPAGGKRLSSSSEPAVRFFFSSNTFFSPSRQMVAVWTVCVFEPSLGTTNSLLFFCYSSSVSARAYVCVSFLQTRRLGLVWPSHCAARRQNRGAHRGRVRRHGRVASHQTARGELAQRRGQLAAGRAAAAGKV
jgi:hypothetical protein